MAFSTKNQQITLVTGKGGVGKSMYSAAYAVQLARKGVNTLLIELGEQSYFTHVFQKEIKYEPTEIMPNFSVALWGGEACLREYVLHLVKIKKVVDLFFNNKVMKTFINAAPALKELAMLGKVTSGVRQWGPPLHYDHLVIDGFSTGHFLSLIKAPMGMSEIIEFGPMGEQSRSIVSVLKNSKICQYKIITLAEELPVTETIELRQNLIDLTGCVPEIICNKIFKIFLTQEEEKLAEQDQFIEFLLNFVLRQRVQLQQLATEVQVVKELPLIFSPNGRDVITEIAGVLS